VTGGILESRFKREVGRSAGNARRTAGSALHIPLPDGRLRQDRATLAAGRGRASLVSPRGTTMARSRLSPSSAHDRTVEPLASPGWALTAASCSLMSRCRASGFSRATVAFKGVFACTKAKSIAHKFFEFKSVYCGFIYPTIRTFVKNFFTPSFPKRSVRNLGVFLRFQEENTFWQ